ncbi:Translation initiation factor SUI1 family protein [Klebsormidium nitens]|uniref:Translation machinery-associated protein 22 n=1 Tax=Klebsormidium nitens TaxID=105231 RepID=A0A1Y1HW12_KLENI|nr:Translation initiation factor SUI1 family protein [Klebsormidium nitens]|eukprot:GAQ80707.1 Translation initiation factor SUI1 family protein [Klebsormidium nitens]
MAHDKLQPQTVLYCGVCGLPPEFCEFGPDFEKCKPWLIKNAPGAYPELTKKAADEAEAKLGDLRLGGEDGADGEASTSKPEDEIVKKLPGGKVKRKEKQEILVEKATRNKRKAITTVKGMELFGVKLGDASKKFGKKFASGSSVVKGPTEKEQIDVQGDFLYDICEFITETWKEIPESAIYVMEDGKRKVPYADA